MTTFELDDQTGTLTVVEPATTTTATFADDDGDCGNLDTPDAGDLNTAARKCAARRGWAMDDGSYPIRSKEMHGAADLAKAIRAVGRGGGSHDEIRRHIMKRASSLDLSDQIPENWTSSGGKGGDGAASLDPNHWSNHTDTPPPPGCDDTFANQDKEGAPCPEGQTKDIDGNCVNTDEREPQEEERGERRTSPRRYDTVTAAAPTRPPKAWFGNPGLDRRTPLTVDEDGHVYGHLASWDECHVGIGNRCITAPRSATSYAYFATGEVLADDGSRHRVGKITLGTGHADPALGFIPAAEHYDNTGAAVAVVACGEDRFGIWVNGGLVPGLNEEKIAELRRSPLSGDWRRIGGNLELVAALAVNTPGFPVLRASAEGGDELEVLLAAGVVTEVGDVDASENRAKRWKQIEDVARSERVRNLLGG